ncbi:MAG TPA: ABC transporter permease [Acidobacteriaceae bacterium]|nr:ABC transporter permease [Acidobacteriaceae bacterium]
MPSLFRDLRFGGRMLARNPGFTLVAILTLALAIGANTAIFSVTSALLLRPFPYQRPQQLVSIAVHVDGREPGGTLMRYELIRERARTFSAAAWTSDNLNLTGIGDPVQLPIARVTPNFFSVLGIRPALGRVFLEADGRTESRPVVLLSNALWRTRFGSRSDVIGATIALDGTPSTVVGVLPADAQFPFIGKAEIFSPRYFEYSLMPAARLRLGVGYLNYLARLHDGVSLDQANAELAVLNRQYVADNPGLPDSTSEISMTATPLRDLVVGDLRGKLWILTAAVGLLLLIGCANVASLLLSRALARRRELAVRSALGATRAAVIRQLLTEALLLACAAGLCGILLGWAADRALVSWAATQLPQGIAIGVDAPVLAFSVAVSLLTGILTGLFPALQLSRADLNLALREEGRGVSGSRSRARLRSALVVGQIALSLLLLIGAGLLVRSFSRLLRTDPGFEPAHILTMEIALPTVKYAKPQQQIDFFQEVLRRVSALPGVQDAAISATRPLAFRRMTPMLPEGQPNVPLAQRPILDIEAVSPRWFSTLRVPILAGRAFSEADNATAPQVVVVNQSFARRFWPNQNPIGKHIVVGRGPQPSEVVGLSQDVHNRGIAEDAMPQIYIPFRQLPWGDMNLLVRTGVAPLSLAPAVEAQIAAVDPDQPVTAVQTVNDLMDTGRAQPRFLMLLLAAFSATALALAAIGLAAMLAWSVVQRRQELAIRLALGAERRDILRLVVRDGLLLACTGIIIGLAAGIGLTQLMASILYKTSTHDWAAFILAPLLFLLIAWVASYLPARRATHVDPVETLRAG